MNLEKLDRGILYIAFGEKWLQEAERSIASLRNHAPDLPVTLITEKKLELGSRVSVDVKPRLPGFLSKTKYLIASPYQRTLFVDTDTYFAEDPTPLFDLLNYYDVGVRFGGPNLREDGLYYHTQCNSGVVLYNDATTTRDMLVDWSRIYDEAVTQRGMAVGALGNQRYLAIAIALSKARPVHLSSSVHCVVFGDTIFNSPPLILHGKDRDLDKIARQIRRGWDPDKDWYGRIWLRNMSGVLPRGVSRSDPFLAVAIVLRRIYNSVWRFLMRAE